MQFLNRPYGDNRATASEIYGHQVLVTLDPGGAIFLTSWRSRFGLRRPNGKSWDGAG